jgi:hypothetical protein
VISLKKLVSAMGTAGDTTDLQKKFVQQQDAIKRLAASTDRSIKQVRTTLYLAPLSVLAWTIRWRIGARISKSAPTAREVGKTVSECSRRIQTVL